MADAAVALGGTGAQPSAASTTAARSVAGRLFSTSLLLLAARLAGAAAGFLVQLLLARALSAHDLGVYFAASSLVVVGGVISAHGYPALSTRFVSRYRGARGARFLASFVRRAQAETMALAPVIAAAVAALGLAVGGDGVAIAIAAAALPFVGAFRLYGSLATATRRFALSYLPDVSLKPVVVLLALAVLSLLGRITLVGALLVGTAATIVLAVAQFAFLVRGFPVELRPWRQARPPPAKALAKQWRREAHATLLVAVFSQFLADLVILAATPFLASADMAAFGICVKLAFLLGFFVSLTQNIAAPDIADAIGRSGERRAGGLACSTKAATVAAALAICGAALFGDAVLRLFAPGFAAAWPALVILVAAQLLRAAFGPVNAVLTILGERRANFLATAAAAAFLLASMATLATAFGLNGAAVAVLLTVLVWLAASARALHRCAGPRVDVLAALAFPQMRRRS